MPSKEFRGQFYFKLTTSGNLLGEFSNNAQGCTRNRTESANRVHGSSSSYEGDY